MIMNLITSYQVQGHEVSPRSLEGGPRSLK